jgi:conjugative transfer pilus assembly protein TraH
MKTLLIAAFFSAAVLAPDAARAGDWTQSWFSTVTATGPSSFDGQKRGYLTGGSLSARYDMGTDNLFSVNLPRVKTSCGGIDLFAGGISFLDPEYLVSKLENILQAAPAMAFNMALKAHCQQCEDIMSKLEAMSTYLNSIQVNDCRLATQLAESIFQLEQDVYGKIVMEASANRDATDSTSKNYKETQSNIDAAGGQPTVDLAKSVASCPAAVKELATGSLVDRAAARVGMSVIADLVRAYTGDLVTSWPAGQAVPKFDRIDTCQRVDRYSAVDFIEGRTLERPVGGACAPNTSVSIIANVRASMASIAAKIQTGAAFTAAEVAFINQSAQPVFSILQNAVMQGTVAETIAANEYPIANALAFRVFDDLLRNTEFLVDKAVSDSKTMGTDPSVAATEACQATIYAPMVAKLGEMRDSLRDTRRVSLAAYADSVDEFVAMANRAESIENNIRSTRGRVVDAVIKE